MGCDKASLRIGRQTLLQQIRRIAERVTSHVRVIRRDRVPRCGPLGGIYTGLITSKSAAELFLACDMPFVTPELLEQLIHFFRQKERPVFCRRARRAGFPCIVPCSAIMAVKERIDDRTLSIQALSRALKASYLQTDRRKLLNLNTPTDLQQARARLQSQKNKATACK